MKVEKDTPGENTRVVASSLLPGKVSACILHTDIEVHDSDKTWEDQQPPGRASLTQAYSGCV